MIDSIGARQEVTVETMVGAIRRYPIHTVVNEIDEATPVIRGCDHRYLEGGPMGVPLAQWNNIEPENPLPMESDYESACVYVIRITPDGTRLAYHREYALLGRVIAPEQTQIDTFVFKRQQVRENEPPFLGAGEIVWLEAIRVEEERARSATWESAI